MIFSELISSPRDTVIGVLPSDGVIVRVVPDCEKSYVVLSSDILVEEPSLPIRTISLSLF